MIDAVGIAMARGGSRRLPRKNLAPVLGRPLLTWVVEAALGSRTLGADRVFVSTEDAEIAACANAAGARVIDRPAALAAEDVWTQPVVEHAVSVIERSGASPDVVVWLNPSVPELTSEDIDAAVERLCSRGLREVVAVGADGVSHSAVRALRREAVSQRALSVYFGVLELDYVDVHTRADLAAAERRLAARVPTGD